MFEVEEKSSNNNGNICFVCRGLIGHTMKLTRAHLFKLYKLRLKVLSLQFEYKHD